jgi:hypothetical protein
MREVAFAIPIRPARRAGRPLLLSQERHAFNYSAVADSMPGLIHRELRPIPCDQRKATDVIPLMLSVARAALAAEAEDRPTSRT